MIKILILIIVVLLFILLLFIIYRFYKRLTLMRMFYASFLEVSRLGLVLAVSGPIRSGKSTLSSGLVHLLTYKIILDLQRENKDIEKILYSVNFAELRSLIDSLEITFDNFNEKFDFLLEKFIVKDDTNKLFLRNNLAEKYFDYLDYHDKLELLKNYILNYLHLKRKSFVFSNIRLFNHITSSYSYEFSNEWLKIKENNDFPLMEHSVFFEDDKLIYDSNLSPAKKLYEEDGTDLFFRLFGHLFKENSYYITTIQNANRWVKHQRELAQTHIYVFSNHVVGNFPFLHRILRFYESLLKRVYSLFKDECYINNNNFFKRQFYKIYQLKRKLFSKSFVYYKTAIYFDIDSVGKDIPEDDTQNYYFDFVLPVPYVFGALNTHEFSVLYDYLYNKSNLKYKDLKETSFDEDELLYLLKKSSKDDNNTFIIEANSSNDLTNLFK